MAIRYNILNYHIGSDPETGFKKAGKHMKKRSKGHAVFWALLVFLGFLCGCGDDAPWESWTEERTLIQKDGQVTCCIIDGFEKQTFTLPHSFPYHNANEWDHAFAQNGTLHNGVHPSEDSIALACHHIKHFACQLDENNPRIKDFDNIVKLCKRRGWQPVFNILAENVDQIDTLCGPDLIVLLEQNVQYIKDRYEPQGVIVVNNLRAVRDCDFSDRDFPTEHYSQTGRLSIAKNVADVLRRKK